MAIKPQLTPEEKAVQEKILKKRAQWLTGITLGGIAIALFTLFVFPWFFFSTLLAGVLLFGIGLLWGKIYERWMKALREDSEDEEMRRRLARKNNVGRSIP